MKKTNISASAKDIVKAMGLVFGDIGTSPIYTLTVIFTLTEPTRENLFGILSLIVWALIILVTVEYAWLAMNLSQKGEGGIIVLREILVGGLKKGRRIAIATFLGYVGVSLLMGDGVITPAITILSAVEGLELIPGIGHISTNSIIIITCVITILLFSFQHKGSDKVASSFGPIMLLWFVALFIFGIMSLASSPDILLAISPHYAIEFFIKNGLPGFLVLSEVILCATGGEALYADMGHLGREPIRRAWFIIFFALIINYFGQGAFVLTHQKSDAILFEMVNHVSHILYVPFLILTILASIIASQAMISAVMSLIHQGISTRVFPLMKVKFTSSHIKSQIYIGAVNWVLMAAVLLMIFIFKKSENLAAAYGFAVTATMTISSIFMIWIFSRQNKKLYLVAASVVFFVDLMFLTAVFDKIPHGGFWSIIIASIPFFVIKLWTSGNQKMYRSFRSLPLDIFLESFKQLYSQKHNIQGTALFFTKSITEIPPYMVHCIIRGNIIYEKNILVCVITTENPYGISIKDMEKITEGLYAFSVLKGYMEVLDLPKIFRDYGLNEKVIFYGVEDIITSNFLLKVFAFLKKVTPSFVKYYKLQYNKLHGVVTRLEI